MPISRIIVLIFLSAAYFHLKAQNNIVPNGSFEKFKNKSSLITNALPWKNWNTVDYYRAPLKHDTSNHKGARTGLAYGGVRFQRDYKEFLYVKLLQPLKAGTSYKFEAYIRLAYWSNVSIKSFGVHFSRAGYRFGENIDTLNSIILNNRHGLLDTTWIKISGTYIAKGKERVITLGNFSEKIKKDFVRLNPFKVEFMKSEAYYFIDDISLAEGRDSTGTPQQESIVYLEDTVFKPNITFAINTPVLLNNVLFEPGKTDLMYESVTQLDKFVAYLNDHPFSELMIIGYTDELTRRGKKLSKERAREICDYLASKDVLNKIYFKGLGSQFPIAPNDTEEGRMKNNRVEFLIIKEE